MSSLHWGHTWLSCVRIPNDGASCQSDCVSIRGERRTQCAFLQIAKQSLRSSKFGEFCFCVFVICENSILPILLFSIFRSVECGPVWPGQRWGQLTEKNKCPVVLGLLLFMVRQPCTCQPFSLIVLYIAVTCCWLFFAGYLYMTPP